MVALTAWEHAARQFEAPTPSQWATPGDLAHHLDPKVRQTPALDLIDHALVRAYRTPDSRLIISMPPQEGKSQRASRAFPLWALTQNPDLRVAIASYEANVARRWGRAIRDDITGNQHALGLQVRPDLSAQHEWQLQGHAGGVYTAGVGGALTGRPVDLAIIDDPIKDRTQADSPTYRDRVWDWWTDVMGTRLAPGAPVVLILTRWHHDDLAGRLLAAEDGHLWDVINIPAQAEHGPDQDPLGREAGEYMVSARGRTHAQWEARRIQSGAATWASLYQGHPTPTTGGIFPKASTWPTYDQPLWAEQQGGARIVPADRGRPPTLIQSWDLAFKGTTSSDYVVGQTWLLRGTDAYLLDQARGRWGAGETIQQIQAMTARWPQAAAKLVEDKANGPAILDLLRGKAPGLIPVNPQGGKEARAQAVAPFTEAGNVHLPAPHLAPWVGDLTVELDAFPHGTHDDQVDALTQALTRLLVTITRNPRATGGIVGLG